MMRYGDWQPTGFDPKGLGLSDQQDWLVGPVGQNRDSGCLEQSNFQSMVKALEEVDESGEDFEIHRFGHWANGWFEIILIRPETKAAECAEEIENALENYPVLDDSDFSEREWEEKSEYWQLCSLSERISLCKEAKVSIFAARRDEIPQGVDQYIEVL